MTTCMACRLDVADDVTVCPHCGKNFPVTRLQNNRLASDYRSVDRAWNVWGGVLGCLFSAAMICSSFSGEKFKLLMMLIGALIGAGSLRLIFRGFTSRMV